MNRNQIVPTSAVTSEARILEHEIAALRKELVTLIEGNDRRVQDRLDYDEKSRDAVAAVLEMRLHAMNEFRNAMADQASRYITRLESDNARGILAEKLDQQIGAVHTRIESDVRPINARLAEQGKPNWTLFIATVSITFGLIAGGWLVVGLKIDAAMSPISQSADQSRVNLASNNTQLGTISSDVRALTGADSGSKADRLQLNDRMGRLESIVNAGQADRRAAQATQAAALVEIGTQFRGLSNHINAVKDTNDQIIGMLWKRVYDEPMPATPYRPDFFRSAGN